MKANKEDIKDDVFNLSEEEFFSKYNKYAKNSKVSVKKL